MAKNNSIVSRKRKIQSASKGLSSLSHVVSLRTSFKFATVTLSNSAAYSIAVFAKLSQVQDYSSYEASFDMYRIKSMTVRYIPCQNVIPTLAGTTSDTSCYMISVIDVDDSNALGSYQSASSYGTAKFHTLTSPWSRTIQPYAQFGVAANESGAATGLAPTKSPWLNTVNDSTEHYGIKVYVPAFSTAGLTFGFNIFVTLDLEFKMNR